MSRNTPEKTYKNKHKLSRLHHEVRKARVDARNALEKIKPKEAKNNPNVLTKDLLNNITGVRNVIEPNPESSVGLQGVQFIIQFSPDNTQEAVRMYIRTSEHLQIHDSYMDSIFVLLQPPFTRERILEKLKQAIPNRHRSSQ